ncbi:MAG: hypothetical protein PHX43_08635 [Alphaproteobacteria bacterium]|nr:hypothetical protein [Alphaproteobacteria bacterium]
MYSSAELLKLIYNTQAVSIWNRTKGPVFWYAASVPGPFYVNTEMVIGSILAKDLLEKITEIIAESPDSASRADKLNKIIIPAYEGNEGYKKLIATMAAKVNEEFPAKSFTAISGGERRDWLFSIPLANALGIKHAFIFKNKKVYCEQPLEKNERILHVSDLINNAASYFDAWLPALESYNLECMGTICVNSRGPGAQKLIDSGQKVVALNRIDISFFEKLKSSGLIDLETVAEIATYFNSSKEWASKYLVNDIRNVSFFDIANLDKKSMGRLVSFFNNDPWGLKPDHEEFFAAMQAAIKTHS